MAEPVIGFNAILLGQLVFAQGLPNCEAVLVPTDEKVNKDYSAAQAYKLESKLTKQPLAAFKNNWSLNTAPFESTNR